MPGRDEGADDDSPISREQLRRLLAGMERDTPALDANERVMLREVLTTWKQDRLDYEEMLRGWRYSRKQQAEIKESRKGRWALIFGIVSMVGTVVTGVISVIVNFFQKP